MEYFKHKTLSIYIWLMIAAWPLMYILLSPVNNAIITFIAFMADFVVHVNKLRKMVYSEYKLIKGTQVTSVAVHIWLLFVISIKLVTMTCAWTALVGMHVYSPLYGWTNKNRVIMIYISFVLEIFCNGLYHRCYKKWIISYNVVSTDDAEIFPLSNRQIRD